MTSALHPGTRILALDLHPQRYGYAVLELPANLLDWGVRRRHRNRESGKKSDLQESLRMLLELSQPSLVLIKESSRRRNARTRNRWAKIYKEVRQRCIAVRRVTNRDVRSAVGAPDGATKHAMASTLVQQFPFLTSTLPPLPRKITDSEDYRMGIFAAVALALAGSGQSCTTSH